MQDMPTIDELQQRLAAALDRIGQRIDRLSAPVAIPDPTPAPELAEAEGSTALHLAERLRALKDREARGRAEAEARIADLTETRDRQGMEVQRLRRTVSLLREALAAQTDALRAGGTEPTLINRAMAAELDALRAQRRSEGAEIEAILSELAPLIGPPDAPAAPPPDAAQPEERPAHA